jgi:hypothetical protein
VTITGVIPTVRPGLIRSATLLDRRPCRQQALHFSFGVYIPVICGVAPDEPEVGFVNQGGRLQCLARPLICKARSSELP